MQCNKPKGADARIAKHGSFADHHPSLIDQWHPTKNGGCGPHDFTKGSHYKVWWRCPEGHDYEASLKERSAGNGCPYCSGRRVTTETSLATLHPKLVEQWDYSKNRKLKPEDVTSGSTKKAWWLCDKGHSWKAEIASRVKGRGCPTCAIEHRAMGAVAKRGSFAKFHPDLAKEWHPSFNNKNANEVTSQSHLKVWWKCDRGHEWEATVRQRVRGQECPYCSGKLLSDDNHLLFLRPDLAEDWCAERNGNLTPRDVTLTDRQEVWWKCKNGHEWKEATKDRVQKDIGCRECNKIAATDKFQKTLLNNRKSLQEVRPELSSEWDAQKNHPVSMDQLLPQGNKKYWWKCSKGHKWQASPKSRSRGDGCPVCAGRQVITATSFANRFPSLMSEWDHDKNQHTDPTQIAPYSSQIAWWKCSKGHEWKASVASRSSGRGCPICNNEDRGERRRKASIVKYGSLQELYPELAKEWNKKKNGKARPADYPPKSSYSAWWTCGFGHEWKAPISNRTAGSGCPFCKGQSSKIELRVYTEVSALFNDTEWRYRGEQGEIDIYIPSEKLGIEIDGFPWHQGHREADDLKVHRYMDNGIKVIRIRDSRLNDTHEHEVRYVNGESMLEPLQDALRMSGISEPAVNDYLSRKSYIAETEYKIALSKYPGPPQGKSLADKCPVCVKEWNYEANHPITPEMIFAGSNKVFEWVCSNGHHYSASPKSRSRGTGCKICGYKKAATKRRKESAKAGRSVAENTPPSDAFWSGDNKLSQKELSIGSNYKAEWLCSKGHSWKAAVRDVFSGSGCPVCSGKKADH